MDIIGFIACCIILVYLSIGWCLLAFNTLGEFNIGGAPNTFKGRLMTFIFLAIIVNGWYMVLQRSPFTVTIN